MALNWDITNIKDNESLCCMPLQEGQVEGDQKMNPITDALIWTCMFVGIPELTEKTILEFWGRMCVVYVEDEWSNGPQTHITFMDLVKHLGLKTNASRRTSAQFYKAQYNIRAERSKKPPVRLAA